MKDIVVIDDLLSIDSKVIVPKGTPFDSKLKDKILGNFKKYQKSSIFVEPFKSDCKDTKVKCTLLGFITQSFKELISSALTDHEDIFSIFYYKIL